VGSAEYMSTAELADLLGLTEAAVTYNARRGKIPGAHKPLGQWRYRRRDIELWLENSRFAGQPRLPLQQPKKPQ